MIKYILILYFLGTGVILFALNISYEYNQSKEITVGDILISIFYFLSGWIVLPMLGITIILMGILEAIRKIGATSLINEFLQTPLIKKNKNKSKEGS